MTHGRHAIQLILSSDCGFGRQGGNRDIAFFKSSSIAQGANIVRRELGLPTTRVFMGDMWKPRTQWDSRYLWMPVEIGDGTLRLREPKAWTVDVQTGEATHELIEPPAAVSRDRPAR